MDRDVRGGRAGRRALRRDGHLCQRDVDEHRRGGERLLDMSIVLEVVAEGGRVVRVHVRDYPLLRGGI